ncbi:hypothetical protein EU527_02885 [Candidatus Thorarchaeota archaeon]|nr:MAG: hypothetical protein EU527_02885 [Candidatus Thorarchaeota archaeon]
MKIAMKAITFLSLAVLLFIITLPMLTTTVDAASVLEREAAAAASIGDTFEILARGRGGIKSESVESFQANFKTQMELCFLLSLRGEYGVVIEVLEGHFSINDTRYSFDNGLGIVGRPTQGEFNGPIIFGFRINVTNTAEEIAQLEFVGRVRRTQDYGPLLLMKGQMTLDTQVFVFGQIGRIHRTQI